MNYFQLNARWLEEGELPKKGDITLGGIAPEKVGENFVEIPETTYWMLLLDDREEPVAKGEWIARPEQKILPALPEIGRRLNRLFNDLCQPGCEDDT